MVREFQQHNYWALILGGSSGLGLATAKKLAQHGMNICVVHRSRKSEITGIHENFDEIKNHGVEFISFNINAFKAEERLKVIDSLKLELGDKGRIRTLVHSVAKGNLKPMIATDKPALKNDDFHLTIDAMAISLYDWTKVVFDERLFADDARLISFTSEGNTKAWPNYAAVSAAKVTLEAITRNIALEFAPYGIRANCVQAGVTDTSSLRAIPGSQEIINHSLKRNPFKRLTLPENVADVVYLLSKDEAAWINGCIIPVDGGEHIN